VKVIAIAWALGAVGLGVAGALAAWLPRGAVPDLGLLAAIALGLHCPGARGLVAAWGIGWEADLLSGDPLGTFALLALLAWTATRLLERQLALSRVVALVPFAAGLAVTNTLLLIAFGVGPRLDDPGTLPVLVLHSVVCAAAAPPVARLIGTMLGRGEAPDPTRPGLRFDAGTSLR
jgi:cell shape-determining protein MreD